MKPRSSWRVSEGSSTVEDLLEGHDKDLEEGRGGKTTGM